MRKVMAVLAGFALWTVLWLGSNAGISAVIPGSFREDGSTDSLGILALILALSVLFSIIAGAVCYIIGRSMKAAVALGVLQLAVGVFVQLQFWDVMPVWYHLGFLALLLPGIMAGAKIRAGSEAAA